MLADQAAGVPCGPISEVEDVLRHPRVAARCLILAHGDDAGGSVRTVASATGFAPSSQQIRRPPELGEHGVEILRDELGYDDARIAELIKGGALCHAGG